MPHPNLQFDADEAQERLQDEISSLLLVLGAEVENKAITFEMTDVIFHNFKRGIRSISASFAWSRQLPTKDEVLQKVQIVRIDTTYRDLLELYIEAQEAPNPRPAGAKMKERLNKKFLGYDSALQVLGLQPDGFDFITKNQSQYKGDRHANFKMGEVPAQMELSKRLEILTLLNDIIQRYEKYLLKSLN